MSLDRDEVNKVAYLARLAIADDKIEGNLNSINAVLELVDQMQSIDTDDVEPMAHPTDALQRLRDDEVSEIDNRDKFQQIAPATEDGLYLVPKVIE